MFWRMVMTINVSYLYFNYMKTQLNFNLKKKLYDVKHHFELEIN